MARFPSSLTTSNQSKFLGGKTIYHLESSFAQLFENSIGVNNHISKPKTIHPFEQLSNQSFLHLLPLIRTIFCTSSEHTFHFYSMNGTRKALEVALGGQDPQRLARVFQLPIDGAYSKTGEPRKHNPQSLSIDGKDYGRVLTALMDTLAAREVVSVVRMDVCVRAVVSTALSRERETELTLLSF